MSRAYFRRGLLPALAMCVVLTASAQIPSGPGSYASVNGIDLYYETHGSGPPLLLLHGGLGHSGSWRHQLAPFAEHFTVIALDSRGHGRSTFDTAPIGYALMASDVTALLDHLALESAHIVGWSDGGIIGLELAIHHPHRVRRIVAFGANYRPEGVRKDLGENARFNRFIASAAADYQKISPAPQRWQEFLDNIGRMWAGEPNYSDDQMRGIKTPVLVLGGLEEEAIEVDHIKATAALIPGAELVLMSGTGHFALWEKPNEFNRVVLDFLSQSKSPTRR